MNAYEQKIEDKKAKYQTMADNAAQRGAVAYKTSHAISEHIPFGQPILVGHHSEKRHRKDIERINSNMQKSIDEDKKKKYYQKKADSYGSHGISGDDPEAVTKLTSNLLKMETMRDEMKAINKDYKKCKGDVSLMTTLDDKQKITLAANKERSPGLYGSKLIPDFQLTNLGARIRNTKKRIEELTKKAQDVTTETTVNGVRVVDNVEDNRLQLFFDGKPEDEIRKKLKSNGFRWSPTNGCWQAYRNHRSQYGAKTVIEKLGDEKIYTELFEY